MMKKKRLTLAATLTGLLLGLTGVAHAQDFNYVADPPHVAVNPSTVIPNGLITRTANPMWFRKRFGEVRPGEF